MGKPNEESGKERRQQRSSGLAEQPVRYAEADRGDKTDELQWRERKIALNCDDNNAHAG